MLSGHPSVTAGVGDYQHQTHRSPQPSGKRVSLQLAGAKLSLEVEKAAFDFEQGDLDGHINGHVRSPSVASRVYRSFESDL